MMKTLKPYTLFAIFLIIHSLVIADNLFENAVSKDRIDENIQFGMYLGTCLDIGSGPYAILTYSLGYVKKQVNKNTCIYLNGTYTENVKLGYLVFERTFHKERGLFFWGYYFGGGYVKWEYRSWYIM